MPRNPLQLLCLSGWILLTSLAVSPDVRAAMRRAHEQASAMPAAPAESAEVTALTAPLSAAAFEQTQTLSWERKPGGLAASVNLLVSEADAQSGWLAALVRDLEPVRSDRKKAAKLIKRRLEARKDLDDDSRELLEQLLREDQVIGDWDPDTDDDRDAIAHAPERDMPATTDEREQREVYQAVALVRADLTTLKRAENDHRETSKMIGVIYEQLSLVRNSLVRGTDPSIGPFAALKIDFTMDVPWPFSSIDARVHSLSRLDDHGHLVTDVYATGEDVLWFEGRDVFIPILDEDGGFVATLVVRSLGFDMSGLPDFEFAQRHGITAGLGNLKRMAESRWAVRGKTPGIEDRAALAAGAVPDFGVIPNR
jgi:hypothetical protein